VDLVWKTFCLCLCFGTIVVAQETETRTWKSVSGDFEIDAALVAVNGDTVTLITSKGRTVDVPVAKLSVADRRFIAKSSDQPKGNAGGPVTISDDMKTELEQFGLKASASGLSLIDEKKLSKGISESKKLKRSLSKAGKDLKGVAAHEAQLKAYMDQLRVMSINLNSRLATATDVATNNKLIGLINVNSEKSQLLQSEIEKMEPAMRLARAEVGKAREAYLEHILGLRKLADELVGKVSELAADEKVSATVAKLNEATGKDYRVTQFRTITNLLRRLKSVEDTILSESIKLRSENGTLYVGTSIGGAYAQEMVLDSGASLICLPEKIAAKCGITVGESDPEITLTLADGGEITGRLVIIDEVRVGKFVVQNVEAAVLGPEATNARPLLGMSFLGKFKFAINPDEATLTMVKVGEK
jgi:clan AA aspartic protease (TIGR02281 family)